MMPMPRTSMWSRVSSALVQSTSRPVHQHGFHDIIGHQAVTAFDEREDGLAFADAAFAFDDDADAEDVTMQPISELRGANIISSSSRRLVDDFIVTSGV